MDFGHSGIGPVPSFGHGPARGGHVQHPAAHRHDVVAVFFGPGMEDGDAWQGGGFLQYGGNCTRDASGNDSGPGHCSSGSTLRVTTYVTGIAALAAGGITLVALIKTVSGSGKDEHAANGSRKAKPAIAVTPVIGPNGAGATLQFDW